MKPILFNTEMVRAILEDRKTVTRRIVKPPALYSIDDILYVRETWGDYSECTPGGVGYYLYRADYPDGAKHYDFDGYKCDLPRWRPSVHMPKEAARLFLRVTDVRVERLQDIDEDGNGYWKQEWNPEIIAYEYKHNPNDELDRLYDFLTALGYEMSDDEKAMQNGTHELFQGRGRK